MKQLHLNEAFREYPAMKKIFCVPCQKNKFLSPKNLLFEFIEVQLVHLYRQAGQFLSFSMNQMHFVVVAYCLWCEILFVSFWAVVAMNLEGCRFIGGSSKGGVECRRSRPIFRSQAGAGAR
jgi:hypothetical protein